MQHIGELLSNAYPRRLSYQWEMENQNHESEIKEEMVFQAKSNLHT